MAVWLAIGSLALPLRISGCVIVVGMWLLILQYSGLNHEHWRLLLLLQVSGIGISLHFMANSWELQLADQSSSPDKEFRFTLREMFGWFTAAASVLAFSSIVWQTSSAAKLPGLGETPRAAAFGLLLIPVACVSTWAVLLSSRRLLPLCSTLLAVTLVSLLVGLVDQSVRRTWWSSLDRMAYTKAYWCVIFLHAATLYASLGCVRGAGYRYVAS